MHALHIQLKANLFYLYRAVKKETTNPGMMSTGRKIKDHSKFKVSLLYIVSSRLDRATQQDPASNTVRHYLKNLNQKVLP